MGTVLWENHWERFFLIFLIYAEIAFELRLKEDDTGFIDESYSVLEESIQMKEIIG